MANLSNIEKMKLEALFGMGSGYILDFSNRSFQEFVKTSSGMDIYDAKYDNASGSKANRFRAFWQQESDIIVGKVLHDLLDYWRAKRLIAGEVIRKQEEDLCQDCISIVNRLLQKNAKRVPDLPDSEDEFLKRDYKSISIDAICTDAFVRTVLEQRLKEITLCLEVKASLAAIFLCGSTLEGLLLSVATRKPKEFNCSPSSPKKDDKVLPFPDWSLSNLIDVACSLGLLKEDVKKFSHALRAFRNYIHPYEQLSSKFAPDEHTAKICWHVLQAAIYQLSMTSRLFV